MSSSPSKVVIKEERECSKPLILVISSAAIAVAVVCFYVYAPVTININWKEKESHPVVDAELHPTQPSSSSRSNIPEVNPIKSIQSTNSPISFPSLGGSIKVSIFIAIPSKSEAYRNIARKTWMKRVKDSKDIIVRFFIDPYPEESDSKSSDLVVVPPSIQRSTKCCGAHFTLWIYRWILTNYDPIYILRMDDDVFLCPKNLVTFVKPLPRTQLSAGPWVCNFKIIRTVCRLRGTKHCGYVPDWFHLTSQDMIYRWINASSDLAILWKDVPHKPPTSNDISFARAVHQLGRKTDNFHLVRIPNQYAYLKKPEENYDFSCSFGIAAHLGPVEGKIGSFTSLESEMTRLANTKEEFQYRPNFKLESGCTSRPWML